MGICSMERTTSSATTSLHFERALNEATMVCQRPCTPPHANPMRIPASARRMHLWLESSICLLLLRAHLVRPAHHRRGSLP